MATLGFERGVSTIGQQVGFAAELHAVIAAARARGAGEELRRRLADAWIGLQTMRLSALRTLGTTGPASLCNKVTWATWHKALGDLAMDVLGPDALADHPLHRLYLFSRADTIYAGTNEIQKNIIAERGLGLPREPS
jgi:alkylation response protein AidB-like acyl-CoA dehydrogenase